MSTNPKNPNRKFAPEFIENAVKLVTVEGYSKIAAAKAVNVPISTLRQWCKKHAAKSGEAGNKPTFEELEAENRQLRKQLRQAELEREILKKATAYFAKESQ